MGDLQREAFYQGDLERARQARHEQVLERRRRSPLRLMWEIMSWKHVEDRGVWSYWENEMTGKRDAMHIGERGDYGLREWIWLQGGQFTQDPRVVNHD